MNKKVVYFDINAKKEFDAITIEAKQEFISTIITLEKTGYLLEPYGKKIGENLFEIRINVQNVKYRAVYFYYKSNKIIIILVFKKKTQRIPENYIKIIKKRIKLYN